MDIIEKIDKFLLNENFEVNEAFRDKEGALKYIKKIKNKEKRLYAEYYMAYLLGHGKKPDPKSFKLSYMGAQSVRLQLVDFAR